MTIQVRNSLKVHVASIGALVAKSHEEDLREYKANFKEMDDYLHLIRDATEKYKTSLKRVNPDFDAEYYDRLILEVEKPQTPAPEDLVGFDQLNPIGTLGTAAGPSALVRDAEASTS